MKEHICELNHQHHWQDQWLFELMLLLLIKVALCLQHQSALGLTLSHLYTSVQFKCRHLKLYCLCSHSVLLLLIPWIRMKEAFKCSFLLEHRRAWNCHSLLLLESSTFVQYAFNFMIMCPNRIMSVTFCSMWHLSQCAYVACMCLVVCMLMLSCQPNLAPHRGLGHTVMHGQKAEECCVKLQLQGEKHNPSVSADSCSVACVLSCCKKRTYTCGLDCYLVLIAVWSRNGFWYFWPFILSLRPRRGCPNHLLMGLCRTSCKHYSSTIFTSIFRWESDIYNQFAVFQKIKIIQHSHSLIHFNYIECKLCSIILNYCVELT